MRFALSPLLGTILVATSFAQQHYANVQPQVPQKSTQSEIISSGLSGRDPFQLNWSTGHFDYAPLPYQHELNPGTPYNPFQYNTFTGRFDYVPVAPPTDDYLNDRPERAGGNASNYLDTRVNPQPINPAPARLRNEPIPASAVFPPIYEPPPPTEIYRRPSARPPAQKKAPATNPATTKPSPAPAT